MAAKRNIDWEAIEREYRAGQLSVVEIARQNGVSHTAINKRAKRDGWARDLTDTVRREVKARLVSSPVSDAAARETKRETIDRAAARGVEVVRQHRKDIGRGRELVGLLMLQLDEASANTDQIEEDIEKETSGDKDGKRKAAMLRAVSLPSRAGVIRDLSAAMKNLIPLERQAFNLDEKDDEAKSSEIKDAVKAMAAALLRDTIPAAAPSPTSSAPYPADPAGAIEAKP